MTAEIGLESEGVCRDMEHSRGKTARPRGAWGMTVVAKHLMLKTVRIFGEEARYALGFSGWPVEYDGGG